MALVGNLTEQDLLQYWKIKKQSLEFDFEATTSTYNKVKLPGFMRQFLIERAKKLKTELDEIDGIINLMENDLKEGTKREFWSLKR